MLRRRFLYLPFVGASSAPLWRSSAPLSPIVSALPLSLETSSPNFVPFPCSFPSPLETGVRQVLSSERFPLPGRPRVDGTQEVGEEHSGAQGIEDAGKTTRNTTISTLSSCSGHREKMLGTEQLCKLTSFLALSCSTLRFPTPSFAPLSPPTFRPFPAPVGVDAAQTDSPLVLASTRIRCRWAQGKRRVFPPFLSSQSIPQMKSKQTTFPTHLPVLIAAQPPFSVPVDRPHSPSTFLNSKLDSLPPPAPAATFAANPASNGLGGGNCDEGGKVRVGAPGRARVGGGEGMRESGERGVEV